MVDGSGSFRVFPIQTHSRSSNICRRMEGSSTNRISSRSTCSIALRHFYGRGHKTQVPESFDVEHLLYDKDCVGEFLPSANGSVICGSRFDLDNRTTGVVRHAPWSLRARGSKSANTARDL